MLRACAPILRTLLSRRAALMSVGSVRYKVYTKTGDGGSTSLYSGERRKKDDAFFHALGDVDELNAAIGLSREHCAPLGGELVGQLVEIQSRLLDAGSAIATPATSSRPEQLARAAFDTAITAHLEAWIDAMEEALPPLKNFILPVRFARPRPAALPLRRLPAREKN
jgi:ATP:cob(I)alamin adenosyltransferase